MQAGLSESQIEQVAKHAGNSLFSPRESLALEYAERITDSGSDVDDEFFARLLAEFETPAAIVELTSIVAFENFRSRFNHALKVESNGVCLLQNASG
jgi:alkylhydroperoxidase family enzyme